MVYGKACRQGMSVSRGQGSTETGGTEVLQLQPSLHYFPLTDIFWLYALPYTTEFVCGGEQCTFHGVKCAIFRL